MNQNQPDIPMHETGNTAAVMDGDIDGFINAYLKAANLGELNLK